MKGKEDHNPVRAQRKSRATPGISRKSGHRGQETADLHAESLGDAAETSSCENLGLHPTWQPP